MSRGRKKVVPNSSDWESVFYNSVGTYVQYMNLKLAEHIKAEPLSNHIRIAGGYAFKSSEYKKQGVPVIRISDFSNEKIVLDDVVYYDESEDLKRYELNECDIVIALTGGTIAKLGIVQKGIGKLYLNQRVGKFEVLHPEEFETEYVYWIARSVQSIIKNLAWGAAIPNVSPKQIEELQFPIPNKETQNGIIDFLNDLRANKLEDDREYFDSEIEDFVFSLQVNQISGAELQSELITQEELLKQLRKAFLREAMQGKLVQQNPNDGNAQELLQKIIAENVKLGSKEKFFSEIKEDEIPFEIPKNWLWCRIGEIGNLKRGKSKHRPRDDKQLFENGTYPFIQTGDVAKAKNNNDLITTVNNYYNEFGLKQSEIQKKGTLCITVAANIAESGFLNFDACVPDSIVCFSAIDNAIEKYTNYYLKIAKEELERFAPATAQKNINLGILNAFPIPLPPLSEQKRIIKKLEELMNVCDELFESINQSKTENERLIKVLLNDTLGVTTTYDVAKDKTLKHEIRKFQSTDNTFERIKMKILEILQSCNEPVSATVIWDSSEYSKDIEAFYAELKRLIDIEKLVVEEKRGKESFLKLASNEN
jgi:type I restriction enzyme S subunit